MPFCLSAWTIWYGQTTGDPNSVPGSGSSPGEGIGYPLQYSWASLVAQMIKKKKSTCNVEDLGSISGLGRSPGGGHGNPLQYSCLENPHGQRILEGCGLSGCKESDTTEWDGYRTQGIAWLRIKMRVCSALLGPERLSHGYPISWKWPELEGQL